MSDSVHLKPGERMDEMGFSGLRLIQNQKAFCYGIDGVLLADFAKVKAEGRICDLGTGTGVIPLILSHKTKASEIWGLEVQQASYELALRNVALNGLEARIHMRHCDVLDAEKGFQRGSFDAVTTNPPYTGPVCGLTSANPEKALARHESTATLEDFISAAHFLLREKGDFYMVHRPSRLVDICALCRKYRLEPKRLRFVSKNRAEAPNILLLHCVKYGKAELTMLKPLHVYEENGAYTKEIEEIYERKK